MASIQQTIPNLLGGVSQQPDDIKLPGQVRKAENVLLDPTFGCLKRPPTRWVSGLARNLPDNAQWFPIFRDNIELYMAAIYRDKSGDMRLKVWSAIDGDEREVNISEDFQTYAGEASAADFRYLTIADYTLLCNTQARPTTTRVELEKTNEALVIVDAVSYNTTYNVDLSAPNAQPVIATRATKLTISPSSWNHSDGSCKFDTATTFTIDYDTALVDDDSDQQDGPTRIYRKDGEPVTGTGLVFRIVTQGTSYREGDDEYECRYKTQIVLYNGGAGWKVNDRMEIQMSGKDYQVRVDEVEEYEVYADLGSASYTSPVNSTSGGLSLADVVSGLVTSIEGIGNFEAEGVDNVIRVRTTDNTPFAISTRGGQSGSNLSSLRETAADVSQLPTQCFNDYRLKIVNTEDSTADDYYVKFVSDQEDIPGPGSWVETVALDAGEYLNKTSMPFALIRESDATFTLAPLDEDSALEGWAGREVGDDKSNPTPTFATDSNRIRGMFLHRNRLGFVTEGTCVLSQPGDYFNFYAVSGVTVSDADPIDISASDTKPVSLKDAISTQTGVVLLGEQAQFSLGTEEAVFSPNTAEMKKISGYDYFGKVLPQHTGVSVMYATSAGEFTKVMELAVQSLRNTPITEETTRAVPRYIPTDIDWSACSPNNDLVLFGKRGDGIYAFRFFNQGNERQLAGWAKWTFAGSIEFAAFKGDDLYLVQRINSHSQLLVMTLVDGPNSPIDVDFTQFRPRVDMQLNSAKLSNNGTITYQNGFKETEWILPTEYLYKGDLTVAFTDVGSGEFETRPIVDNKFKVEAGRTFRVGVEYNGTITLPRFWVQPDPNKQRADHVSPPMVQHVYLDLFNSGAIKANLEVRGYPTQDFFLEVTDADDYAADEVVVRENVTYDLPVFQRGDFINLTLNSTTPFPTAVTSYSWTGQYNKRGYRLM